MEIQTGPEISVRTAETQVMVRVTVPKTFTPGKKQSMGAYIREYLGDALQHLQAGGSLPPTPAQKGKSVRILVPPAWVVYADAERGSGARSKYFSEILSRWLAYNKR